MQQWINWLGYQQGEYRQSILPSNINTEVLLQLINKYMYNFYHNSGHLKSMTLELYMCLTALLDLNLTY